MKPIVDYIKECEANNKKNDLSSDAALSSGFTMAGKKSIAIEQGYVVIKKDRIFDYLEELIKESLLKGEQLEYIKRSTGYENNLSVEGRLIERSFAVFRSDYRYWTDTFIWDEILVEEYQEIPPAYVYQKLLKAREQKIFDYFTVAVIKKVKDPLLLGRITGDENRYFIAQWDDDIQLDNLI